MCRGGVLLGVMGVYGWGVELLVFGYASLANTSAATYGDVKEVAAGQVSCGVFLSQSRRPY